MKKLLKILIWFLIISAFIYSRWIYIDFKNDCRFVIIPSLQLSNQNTKEILKIVKRTAPESYADLCQNVTVINKNPSCGGFDGGCYHTTKPHTIYLGNDQGNPAMSAALVVHETCHVMQGIEGRPLEETECYALGSAYLEKVIKY